MKRTMKREIGAWEFHSIQGSVRCGQARHRGRARVAATLLALVLGGCLSPNRAVSGAGDPRGADDLTSGAANRELEERRVLGHSVAGRPIEAWSFGTGGETVLYLATIHGDEAAGTPLLEALCAELRRRPELLGQRRAVVIPVANPDGLELKRRGNQRGVDLNRNFPAKNFRGQEPLSEPESRALTAWIRTERPAAIISIHQPASQIDYDGPARALAQAMAEHSHLGVDRMGSRPGSLGSYAGVDLGLPVITLELPSTASRLDRSELWNTYGELLLEALRHPLSAGNEGRGETALQ